MAGANQETSAAIRQLTYNAERKGVAAALWDELPGVCYCLNSRSTVEWGAEAQQ
jgi:hypothetical protein